MSSNVPWTNQFDTTNFSPANNSVLDSNWRTAAAVNTPQSNPSSWPQLGSAAEQEVSAMSQTQLQTAPSQEDAGWNTTSSIPTTSNDVDQSGTSGWGRIPDTGTQASNNAAPTGWGVPTGTWGQHSSNIDDGTAVWGKSNAAQQPSGNWGNPVNKSSAEPGIPSAAGWGSSETPSSIAQSNMQNPDMNQQLQGNNNPQLTNSNQPSTTSQSVSWAKAASAGLPAATNSTEANSGEDQDSSETGGPSSAPPSEPDPVQQLVNSHEGWGTKPVQQGTSWNISDRNPNPVNVNPRTYPPVNNGTEAWGKPTAGQMPPNQGWNDANKSSGSGWGANYGALPSQPAVSTQNWGVPQQPRPGFMPNNPNGTSGWGDQQGPQRSAASGRWNDMPGQAVQNNWSAPPVPQHPQGGGGSGWGAMQPSTDAQNSSSWGNMPSGRPMQPNNGWGNVQPSPHSPATDQSQWNRPDAMMSRRMSNVDDGTSAWGDPTTYNKVNMWDKHKQMNAPDNNGGMNSQNAGSGDAKGWGVPTNQNQPPSPKNWGTTSPTRMAGDAGNSGWGFKPVRPDKPGTGWDKPAAGGGWNTTSKPSGWGQPNEAQWGQTDNTSSWGQQMGKNENMMKNMDYGPRGNAPQPNINQQLRNPMPPLLPPQLQNQFHQIRNAVMNGVIPQQFLNPQVMTPQHMHTLLQLVNKASEYQRMQLELRMLTQNKSVLPPMRQQQMIEYTRIMRACQQQIEMQRNTIFQNMLQKTQSNKSNGPIAGMDPNGPRSAQSMLSPLNNMANLGQALPPNVPMPNNREQKSRFMHNWKRPNSLDYPQNLPNNMGFFPGPGGDFNGMRFESPQDEMPTHLDKQYYSSDTAAKADEALNAISAAEATSEPSALADIGPPEFTPGVPWKGFRRIDPESDPDITPGSVAIAKTMSINTVRDADQVLKRERSAHSESSTGMQNNEENPHLAHTSSNAVTDAITSAMWSTGANGASSTTTVSQSATPQDMWKLPINNNQSMSRAPPPGMGAAFRTPKELAPTWDNAPSNSWEQNLPRTSQGGSNWSSQPPPPQQQEGLGSWLVLTNFNQQVDVSSVRQLCMQHGTMVSFQAHYPIEGMALVRYASPDDAANAKKALNMYMAGSTMLVATVATDHEVANFANAAAGGSWGSNAGNPGNRFSTGSTGGFMSQPSQPPTMGIPPDTNPAPSQPGSQLWGGNTAGGNWASNFPPNMPWSGAGGEDLSRIMSPMHSLLPENLLGGETM